VTRTKHAASNRADAPKNFEEALTELESLVGDLEEGNLLLDLSVERFRQASELADYCKSLITEARLRVTELQSELPIQTTLDGAGDDVPF
jgi:exodeoxyribonuclease VII small subunit